MKTKKLVLTAICLAGCILLPFLTGQIPQIGKMLSPMHFPVLICGFLCGWQYGFALGAVAPLLRSLILGSPPLFPVAVAMSFEMAVYGLCTGLLCLLFIKRKNVAFIYINLVVSMIVGRIVWGLVMTVLSGISSVQFGWEAFVAGALTNAVPAIVLQIIVVPVVVIILKKAGFDYNGKSKAVA